MFCITGAYTCGCDFRILRIPRVSRLAPVMPQSVHVHQSLSLHRERCVLERFTCVRGFAGLRAGGLQGDLSGRSDGISFHMIRVPAANPGSNDTCVVLVPSISWLTPVMA